jgi:thioester reductase-like protein
MLTPDWPFAPSPEVASARTIAEVLAWRAQSTPDRVGYVWLDGDGLTDETPITYGALYDEVQRAAARLAETLAVNDRAVLLFDSGLDFLRAFLACQVAGVVPVPVMPPRDASSREIGRVMRIVGDAATSTVVTTAPIAMLAAALPGADALDWRVRDGLEAVEPLEPRAPADLALLQYTSGSTSAPRGVMVGHDNLLRNLAYIYWGENNGPDSVSVSWLPMTHDMGLVEGVMEPLYSGHPVYLFHPGRFLKRPLDWLAVIDRVGATVSGGPNFAYELVLRRLGDGPLPSLDLSRWRFAYDGSEPVRAETVDAFCARMAPLGFRRATFQPLYGMAEATLGVTAGRFGAGPRFQSRVDGTRVVSCGVTPDDLDAVVVDPETGTPLADGAEGEIWLSGPCIARGYWRNSEATEVAFGGRIPGSERTYLKTGDLGFQLDGELFVTGRRKELIICRGRNVHPGDLEITAEDAHPLVRPGGSVAFGVEDDGQEAVVLVAEVARKLPADAGLSDIASAIRSALARHHGVPVAAVALVKAGTVPRTTSGKRQRARVARSWAKGSLDVLERVEAREAPAESLSDWLPTRVAELLGVASVDPDATLPELGLGSLAVLELAAELERFGGVPLTALLTRPLGSLAEGAAPAAVCEPAPLTPRPGPRGDAILLTGATGFVGSHIARELLRTTDRRLICTVRGDASRVHRAISGLPGWTPDWAERIEALPADLSQPALGLSEDALDALSARVGHVIHAAAQVNWVYPESALAPTNVGGTRTLLALACRRSTPFTFLSSLACCWSLSASEPVDGDTDPATLLDGIHLPYVRTKARAESLVRQAGAAGLPVHILRPGLVVGDSETGHHHAGDFLASLFKGCITLGAAPDLDWDLEVCPVDVVARAATETLETTPTTTHLESPERRPWRGVVLWMALRGHPMALLPFRDWCERLVHQDSALRPLEAFFTRPVVGELTVPQLYERGRRNPIVAPNPPVGPSLDAAFLERSFTNLTARGYLPSPTDPPPPSPKSQDLDALTRALGRPVDAVREVPFPTPSHSLIGELASWRHGRAAGVRRLELTSGNERFTVVEKAQVDPDDALDIGQVVADLCSPALGAAWRAHRPHSEVVRSAQRERALYELDLPTPRLLGVDSGVLLLEDLSEAAPRWDAADLQVAIAGLGRIHATPLPVTDWMPPPRTTASLITQQPLWDALAEHALRGSFGRWLGSEGRGRYESLVSEVAEWAAIRDALPQTLIHNDFSPRNATLHRGELKAWDWELAGIGLPQRDLAELLCFVGSADALPNALSQHGAALEHLDTTDWRTGFEVALAELLVTRLAMYAMIDGFRRQAFLERVTRTWVALDRAIREGSGG